jgi:hypothetical protein
MFSQLGRLIIVTPQIDFPLWLSDGESKQKSRQNQGSLNEFTEKEDIKMLGLGKLPILGQRAYQAPPSSTEK